MVWKRRPDLLSVRSEGAFAHLRLGCPAKQTPGARGARGDRASGAPTRTTLVLDDKAREAARQLARRYGCSLSEATRRALVRQRDAEVGIPRERRRRRVEALRRLFELFADNDPAAEVRRLKAEDEGLRPGRSAAAFARWRSRTPSCS